MRPVQPKASSAAAPPNILASSAASRVGRCAATDRSFKRRRRLRLPAPTAGPPFATDVAAGPPTPTAAAVGTPTVNAAGPPAVAAIGACGIPCLLAGLPSTLLRQWLLSGPLRWFDREQGFPFLNTLDPAAAHRDAASQMGSAEICRHLQNAFADGSGTNLMAFWWNTPDRPQARCLDGWSTMVQQCYPLLFHSIMDWTHSCVTSSDYSPYLSSSAPSECLASSWS